MARVLNFSFRSRSSPATEIANLKTWCAFSVEIGTF